MSKKSIFKSIAWLLIACIMLGMLPSNFVYAADDDLPEIIEDEDAPEDTISVYGDIYRVIRNEAPNSMTYYYLGDSGPSREASLFSNDEPRDVKRDNTFYFIIDEQPSKKYTGKVFADYVKYDSNPSDGVEDSRRDKMEVSSLGKIPVDGTDYTVYEVNPLDGSSVENKYDAVYFYAEYESAGKMSFHITNFQSGKVWLSTDGTEDSWEEVFNDQVIPAESLTGAEHIYIKYEANEGMHLEWPKEGEEWTQYYCIDGIRQGDVSFDENNIAVFDYDSNNDYSVYLAFASAEEGGDKPGPAFGDVSFYIDNSQNAHTYYSLDGGINWNEVFGGEFSVWKNDIPERTANILVKYVLNPDQQLDTEGITDEGASVNSYYQDGVPTALVFNDDCIATIPYDSSVITDIFMAFVGHNDGPGNQPGPAFGDVSFYIDNSQNAHTYYSLDGGINWNEVFGGKFSVWKNDIPEGTANILVKYVLNPDQQLDTEGITDEGASVNSYYQDGVPTALVFNDDCIATIPYDSSVITDIFMAFVGHNDGPGNPGDIDGATAIASLSLEGEAEFWINGIEAFNVDEEGKISAKASVTYPYDSEKATTVEFEFASFINSRYTSLNINGQDYSGYIPGRNSETSVARQWDILDAMDANGNNQTVSFKINVPYADDYVIKADRVMIGSDDAPDYCPTGNFLWSNLEEDRETDSFMDHTTLEFISFTYTDRDSNKVTIDSIEQLVAADHTYLSFDNNPNKGGATLIAGGELTVRIIPQYGYQVVKFGPNGTADFETGDEIGVYTFTIGNGNFHLGAHCEAVDDAVNVSGDCSAISSGSISVAEDEFEIGTAVLNINEAVVSEAEKDGFARAVEGYAVEEYLEISLDNVIYKGNADKVWTEEKAELNSNANIALKIDDEVRGGDFKVVHQKHDGTYEVMQYIYDSNSRTLSFDTDSFSKYAIVSYNDDCIINIHNEIASDIGTYSVEGTELISSVGGGDTHKVLDDRNTITIKVSMSEGYMPILDYGVGVARNTYFKYNSVTKKYEYSFELQKEYLASNIYLSYDIYECRIDVDFSSYDGLDNVVTARVGSRALDPKDISTEGHLIYSVQQGTTVTFTVNAVENYKFNSLTDDGIKKTTKVGGDYAVKVTSEDVKNITLDYSPISRVIVERNDELISGEEVSPVSGVYSVNNNGYYYVYVKNGNGEKELINEILVNTSGINPEFISEDESGNKFINPSVAPGKTVECTVSTEALGTTKIKFKIPSNVTTVSIKGADKNNVIKQNTGVERLYKITYNKGSNPENISVEIDDNYVYDLFEEPYEAITCELSEDKSTLKISTNFNYDYVNEEYQPICAEEFPNATITIKDGDTELKSYEIQADNSYLAKTTPSASVYYTTDDKIYLKVSLPSSVPSDVKALRYEVRVYNKDEKNLVYWNEIAEADDIYVAECNANGGIICIDESCFIGDKRFEAGKSYDVYVVCSLAYDEEYSKEKKVTATTKTPCYETKLTLSQKTKSFYANSNKLEDGYDPILLAEAKFSKKTSYYNLTADLVNNGNGVTYASTDDNLEVVNINKIMINDTSNLVPGDYTLYVYSDQGSSTNEVKASCKIKVTAPTEIKSLTGLPTTVYKKDKTASTFTVKPNFIDAKPANSKVTYEIVTGSDYVKKNVTISKDGKVTINKAFIVSNNPANNMFRIKVTPVANYSGSYYISHDIEITSEAVALKKISLVNGGTVVDISSGLTATEATGKMIQILDDNGNVVDNASLKWTSNNKNVTVDADGRLSVTGVVPAGVTIKAETMDGGKSSITVKIKILYKNYGSLSITVNGQSDNVNTFDNDKYKTETFTIEVLGDGNSIDDVTNYTISVTNAKLVLKEDNVYYYLPTGMESIVTLTDKTKKSSESGYQTKYTVKNTNYAVSGTSFSKAYNFNVYAADGLNEDFIKSTQGMMEGYKYLSYYLPNTNKELNDYFIGRDIVSYTWDKYGKNSMDIEEGSQDVYCEIIENQAEYNKDAATKERYDNFRNSWRKISFTFNSNNLENSVHPGYMQILFDGFNYHVAAGTYKYSMIFYCAETGEAITGPCDFSVTIAEAPKVSISGKVFSDVRIGNTANDYVNFDGSVMNLSNIKNRAGVVIESYTDANVNGVINDYARYLRCWYDDYHGTITALVVDQDIPDNIKNIPLVINVVVYDFAGNPNRYSQIVNVAVDSSIPELVDYYNSNRYDAYQNYCDESALTYLFGYDELVEFESKMSELQYKNINNQKWQDARIEFGNRFREKIPKYVENGAMYVVGTYDSSKLDIISWRIGEIEIGFCENWEYAFLFPEYSYSFKYNGYTYNGQSYLWSTKCFEEQLDNYLDQLDSYDECIEFINTYVEGLNPSCTVSDGKLVITYNDAVKFEEHEFVYAK